MTSIILPYISIFKFAIWTYIHIHFCVAYTVVVSPFKIVTFSFMDINVIIYKSHKTVIEKPHVNYKCKIHHV